MHKQPDLLFLSIGFPPEQVGGVEQHTLELATWFAELGITTGIYTRGERSDLKEYDTYQGEYRGFPVHRVIYRWGGARTLRHIYDDEQLAVAFGRYLERNRPRLIHAHHLGGLGLSCLQVAKDAGIPLVMTLHDYFLICPRGQMFNADLEACDRVETDRCAPCIAATWPGLVPSGSGAPFAPEVGTEDADSVAAMHDWLRRMLALPDALLTPSEPTRRRFLDFGVPPDRIRVVENGLDVTPFTPVERTPSERVRFGFVGTLLPSKGAHTLVEAFAKLPAGSASLTLAGNAPPFYQHTTYMEEIRELAAAVPEGNPVEILGEYDHADLPRILAEIDVLVVPPLWEEVYGLTLREGILAGCAVLASRVGGLAQAVDEGRNGYTYSPGNVEELFSLMSNFIQDRGLAGRLGGSESRVRTIQELGRELLALYGSLGVNLA